MLPDAKAQAQAEHRLSIVNLLREFADLGSNAERELWCLNNGVQARNVEDLARQLAAREGCSWQTVFAWLKRFKDGGFAALADRVRADKGQSRWFKEHPDAGMFAWYLFLVEKSSVSFIYDELGYQRDVLGLTGVDLPSRETVRIFLSQSISPAIETLARKGDRAYHEMVAPYIRRGYVDIYANQVWVGDHCIHDQERQNDMFADVPLGTPGRLRNSTFIDYRSRYAWSTFAWEGSSRSIAATMLRAMLEVGPPEHIYVDNGKDYKKVAKGAQRGSDDELLDDEKAPREWWNHEYERIENTGLLARLGIKVTHCIPRHPQSKHVERFFRTMHQRFDAISKTYTSGSPWTRPELTEKLMMRHRRLLKAGRESNYPTASQMIIDYLCWLEEYNNTPQRGEGMDGRSPREVFEANLNPKQRPVPESKDLVLLMAERVRRKVHECAVQLNNYRYTPATKDRAAWLAMHEVTGTEILVLWNPEDPEYAAALTIDGRLIAWLEAEELARFAPGDEAVQHQIGANFEIRRGLEKSAKQAIGVIEANARALGVKSPEESLRGRHSLPANVGIVASQRKPRLKADRKIEVPKTPAEVVAALRKLG